MQRTGVEGLGIETNLVASLIEMHAMPQTSGEVMAKWYFKTAALNARNSSRHLWYWQIDSDAAVIFTGIRLFATLSECVSDARAQGFRGMLNVPQDIAHPVVITCIEDASGAYVTTVNQQAA